MAYREVSRVEIAEVVRRWQSGESQRQIASGTGLSRKTVRRYIRAGVEAGLTRDGPVPSEDQLTRLVGLNLSTPRKVETPTEEVLAPWADQVYEWLTADRLQVTRIHELLADRGCRVSYASVGRFIRRRGWQRRSATTVRMGESAPGEVAEMDFGRLGLIEDPETSRRRVVWALIIVLTYSRHSFVWPTFSQKLVDVIEGLEAAWGFFEGVPKYLVIDNFPAAVAGPDRLHPRLTRGFLEYSQHRGFISDPARVRHPRDKPRVERGVPYVRERFFKGGDVHRPVGHEVCGQAMVHGGGRTEGARHHPQAAFGRLPPGGAQRAGRVGRRAIRDDRLAHGQGASRPSHSLPVRPLLGALCDMPARAESGGSARQQAGAHLPPGKADQGPPAPGSRRQVHRPRRLPGTAERLHPQSAGADQAQRGVTGTGRGSLCRASLRRPAAMGQAQAGTQAHTPGRTLLP